jgi:probable HAF family extracellular repeat protein
MTQLRIHPAARRHDLQDGTSPSPNRRTGRKAGRFALLALAVTGAVALPAASASAGAVPSAAAGTVRAGSAGATSPHLRLVDLGTLGAVCCSQATAINNHGDVVGDSNIAPPAFARHAFRWHAGRMVDLGTLGGHNSTANDINNHGHVAGASDRADGSTHAVLWRGGRMIDLGTLGGDNSYATAVNDSDEVVGFSATTPGGFIQHGFSWRNGVMTDLGVINGGYAHAYDINNHGQIVGDSSVDGMNSVPVRWRHGTPSPLTTGFGAASAINDRGQVTGYYFGGHGSFLWSGGRVTNLGTLPGATFTQSYGINNHGQVVGYTDFDAFVWQHGKMTALPRLAGGGTAAYDINDRGQIVGYSATNSEGSNPHAVLWTR